MCVPEVGHCCGDLGIGLGCVDSSESLAVAEMGEGVKKAVQVRKGAREEGEDDNLPPVGRWIEGEAEAPPPPPP